MELNIFIWLRIVSRRGTFVNTVMNLQVLLKAKKYLSKYVDLDSSRNFVFVSSLMTVFENSMLRRIFGPKRDEVTEE
jgi:hypothetical protein